MRLVKVEVFENTTKKGGYQVNMTVQFHQPDDDVNAVKDRILAFFEKEGDGSIPLVSHDTAKEEETESKPRGRRRRKDVGGKPSDELDDDGDVKNGSDESDPEDAPEPEKPRRRRRKKAEEAPAEEPEAEEEPEEEAPKPRRRRRKKAEAEEPEGPTKEDVAKAASMAASELGAETAAEIILDYAPTGKLDDIPAEKRQEFIDDVNNELSDDPED